MRPALVLLAAGALACGGSNLPHPRYAPQVTSALEVIPHEPPPARVEKSPPPPKGRGDVVWIDGEWAWRRRKWAWVPGRWVAPPAGATYSPWITVRGPDGTLYFAPAVWKDAQGRPIETPTALAVATVDSGAVVDAEGEMERTTVAPPP